MRCRHPKNILMNVVDNTPFTRYEEVHGKRPWPRKELDDRTIYASQPMMLTAGLPKLCDLGEARKLEDCRKEDLLMPIMYRAPEVILEMPWSYPVDVWSSWMTLWDLLHPHGLFYPFDAKGRYHESIHLAQLTAIMGPPPMDFVQRSKLSSYFWDMQCQDNTSPVPVFMYRRYEGDWWGSVPVEEPTLERRESALESVEKAKFLKLMRKILQ
ncbi:hypothetical protein LTR95_014957 [Oleoguttula sp. CCFEE 5521]